MIDWRPYFQKSEKQVFFAGTRSPGEVAEVGDPFRAGDVSPGRGQAASLPHPGQSQPGEVRLARMFGGQFPRLCPTNPTGLICKSLAMGHVIPGVSSPVPLWPPSPLLGTSKVLFLPNSGNLFIAKGLPYDRPPFVGLVPLPVEVIFSFVSHFGGHSWAEEHPRNISSRIDGGMIKGSDQSVRGFLSHLL